jgi:hypothetical protein
MANKRRSKDELKEIDVVIERLREFTRLNYVTAVEIAQRIETRNQVKRRFDHRLI